MAVFECPLCKVGVVKDGVCKNCRAKFCQTCHGTTNPDIKSVPRCCTSGNCHKAVVPLIMPRPKGG